VASFFSIPKLKLETDLMKTLSIIFVVLIAGTSAWAQQAMGNSRVNTDFGKYHSFTWAQSDSTTVGPDGYDIYYFNADSIRNDRNTADNKSARDRSRADKTARVNAMEPYYYSYAVIIPAQDEGANTAIMDAISNELEGRGYQEQENSGDLIVSYQVFDKKAKLHGYTNDDPTTLSSGEQVRTPEDQTVFTLEPGTLLITLIDAGTSQVVWDGFSKDLVSNNTFVTDEVRLKEAVHDVFRQFRYSADKAKR
jgi:hypothetical protein